MRFFSLRTTSNRIMMIAGVVVLISVSVVAAWVAYTSWRMEENRRDTVAAIFHEYMAKISKGDLPAPLGTVSIADRGAFTLIVETDGDGVKRRTYLVSPQWDGQRRSWRFDAMADNFHRRPK